MSTDTDTSADAAHPVTRGERYGTPDQAKARYDRFYGNVLGTRWLSNLVFHLSSDGIVRGILSSFIDSRRDDSSKIGDLEAS